MIQILHVPQKEETLHVYEGETDFGQYSIVLNLDFPRNSNEPWKGKGDVFRIYLIVPVTVSFLSDFSNTYNL